MRIWTALLVIAIAIVLFVFLVPLPIPALEPSIYSYLEPVTIYGSIASKYFGSGAVIQISYMHSSSGTPFYCIQQHFSNGYSYACLT